jgi:hypothetical protein
MAIPVWWWYIGDGLTAPERDASDAWESAPSRQMSDERERMETSSLIALASSWVQANCPDRKLRSDLIRRLEEAEEKQLNCSFTIGPALTKSSTPYLVHCYSDQLFVFPLTAAQVQRLEIGRKRMRYTEHAPRQDADSAFPVYVMVDELEIENGANLRNSALIQGRCTYSMRGIWQEPFTLGLEFELKGVGNVLAWALPIDGILQPDGVLHFSFPSIASVFGQATATWTGTTAVFLRLYTLPDENSVAGRIAFSNACAALVDVH